MIELLLALTLLVEAAGYLGIVAGLFLLVHTLGGDR